MQKYLIAFCLTFMFAGNAPAPIENKPIEMKFFDKVRGAKWERFDALKGFQTWPAVYGHSPQEIYDMVERESQFDVDATSEKGGMGLGQPTRYAIESIDDGTRYYRFYIDESGRKVWIMLETKSGRKYHALHYKRIYTPSFNLKISCQFLRVCKNMARRNGPDTVGRFTFSTNELAKIYYVAGHGTYHRRLKVVLRYIQ